jgi:phosphatidylglycerophosphate synthase
MSFSFEDPSRVHHYVFNCNDRSWIQPYFNRLINDRLLHLLPGGLSPNLLTFIGHGSAWLAFIMICLDRFSVCMPLPRATVLTAVIALMFIYCICDSLDGMYARYWKVETPLGDFYDHWLDCFIGFTIPVGGLLVLDIPPQFIGLLTLCYGFGWTANNLERRENRSLVLPAFGAMEANFLVIGVCVSAVLIPSLIFSSRISLYVLFALGCLGFINAGREALVKMRGSKIGLFGAMLGITPVILWSILVADREGQQWLYGLLAGSALIMKYNGDILRNILIGTSYKPWDFVPVCLGALLLAVRIALKDVVPDYTESMLLALIALWAVGICAVQFIHTTLFCCRELDIRVFTLSPRQRAVAKNIDID